jgi:anti-anti-sigma factor
MDQDLSVDVAEDGPFMWLRVHGDLDDATAPDLSALVTRTPAGGRHVVVDLTPCTFLDSGGVRGLVAIERHLRDLGQMVVVSPPGGPARMVLDLVGFGEAVEVLDHADDVAGVER